MGFFDSINENLFRPLTTINKQRYMDVLSLLWNMCRRKPMYTVSKSEAIDEIEAYFIGYSDNITIDDNDEDEQGEGEDARLLATHFLRKLKSTGWLIEREGEYEEETQIALNHQIVPLLKSFADIVNPKIITYKGKLFEIFSMLDNIEDNDNPYENCLKVAEENFQELNISLHQLEASIEDHIEELTKGKKPEEILELFDRYEEKIVVGAYQRFKTNDNLYYYKNSLYDKLDFCDGRFLETLVLDCRRTEKVEDTEARLISKKLISSIRENLSEMEEIMAEIDKRHILYRTRAAQRAQFLLLADGSTKSKINGLLQNYALGIKGKDEIYDIDNTEGYSAINLYGQGFFDEQSLATPYKRRSTTPIAAMMQIEELDLSVVEDKQRELFEYAKNALTSENVNRFADELLANKTNVTAEQALNDEEISIAKIIGIYTYSVSPERTYNVRLKENYVIVDGVRFRDFIIERK